MPTNLEKNFFRLLLIMCSIFILLIGIELYLRFFNPIMFLMPPSQLPKERVEAYFSRQSDIPGLSYDLVPDKTSIVNFHPAITNSYGMRDDEPNSSDKNPPRRLVAIGDSFTFGYGVKGEDTYPNVLERLINRHNSNVRFEVLNLGVGGYSTKDESIVLEHRGLNWNPELVIIGYTLNDPEIEPLQPLHRQYNKNIKWCHHINLLRLVAKLKFIYDVRTIGQGDYYRYLHNHKEKWESVVSGFEQISKMTNDEGIPVLLVIFPMIEKEKGLSKEEYWESYPYKDLPEKIAKTAREYDFNVIDLYQYYSEYPPQDLKIFRKDHHPNKAAHELAADVIFKWISENQELMPEMVN